MTVMDFGQSFPLDLHPWLPTSEILQPFTDVDDFAVKDRVPSVRFETHDSASMLFRRVDIGSRRLPDAGLALVHRIADLVVPRRLPGQSV